MEEKIHKLVYESLKELSASDREKIQNCDLKTCTAIFNWQDVLAKNIINAVGKRKQ